MDASLPDADRIQWYHIIGGVLAAVFLAALLPAPSSVFPGGEKTGRLGVVKLHGPIAYQSDLSKGGISPSTIADLTEQAKREGADAIMYEINSGGGAVVASRQAARYVENVDVPTVCRIQEVAASGAYWIASACDVIVADELSVTGSIGVTSSYLEVSGLLERFGVEYVNLTAGRYKEMGSQYKNITPQERERFQDVLDTVHETFIQDVAENRNMTTAAVRELATGEIYTGQEAAVNGLVDRTGPRSVAVAAAKELTNTTKLEEKTYAPPRQINPFALLFSKIGEGIVHGLQSSATSNGAISARWRNP